MRVRLERRAGRVLGAVGCHRGGRAARSGAEADVARQWTGLGEGQGNHGD